VFEEHCKVGVLFIIIVTTIDTEKKLKQLLAFYFSAFSCFSRTACSSSSTGATSPPGHHAHEGGEQDAWRPNTFSATLLHALPYLVRSG